jgi:hypothetical protein
MWMCGRRRRSSAQAEIARLRAARPNFTVQSFAATQFRKNIVQVEADLAALHAAGLPDC